MGLEGPRDKKVDTGTREWETCPSCRGNGKSQSETCPRCKGQGKIRPLGR